jgi:hypothetical protein
MNEPISEFAVATLNPISRRWIYGEVTVQYKAEKKFAELKTRGVRCRLIKRQVTKWEMVEESEVSDDTKITN